MAVAWVKQFWTGIPEDVQQANQRFVRDVLEAASEVGTAPIVATGACLEACETFDGFNRNHPNGEFKEAVIAALEGLGKWANDWEGVSALCTFVLAERFARYQNFCACKAFSEALVNLLEVADARIARLMGERDASGSALAESLVRARAAGEEAFVKSLENATTVILRGYAHPWKRISTASSGRFGQLHLGAALVREIAASPGFMKGERAAMPRFLLSARATEDHFLAFYTRRCAACKSDNLEKLELPYFFAVLMNVADVCEWEVSPVEVGIAAAAVASAIVRATHNLEGKSRRMRLLLRSLLELRHVRACEHDVVVALLSRCFADSWQSLNISYILQSGAYAHSLDFERVCVAMASTILSARGSQQEQRRKTLWALLKQNESVLNVVVVHAIGMDGSPVPPHVLKNVHLSASAVGRGQLLQWVHNQAARFGKVDVDVEAIASCLDLMGTLVVDRGHADRPLAALLHGVCERGGGRPWKLRLYHMFQTLLRATNLDAQVRDATEDREALVTSLAKNLDDGSWAVTTPINLFVDICKHAAEAEQESSPDVENAFAYGAMCRVVALRFAREMQGPTDSLDALLVLCESVQTVGVFSLPAVEFLEMVLPLISDAVRRGPTTMPPRMKELSDILPTVAVHPRLVASLDRLMDEARRAMAKFVDGSDLTFEEIERSEAAIQGRTTIWGSLVRLVACYVGSVSQDQLRENVKKAREQFMELFHRSRNLKRVHSFLERHGLTVLGHKVDELDGDDIRQLTLAEATEMLATMRAEFCLDEATWRALEMLAGVRKDTLFEVKFQQMCKHRKTAKQGKVDSTDTQQLVAETTGALRHDILIRDAATINALVTSDVLLDMMTRRNVDVLARDFSDLYRFFSATDEGVDSTAHRNISERLDTIKLAIPLLEYRECVADLIKALEDHCIVAEGDLRAIRQATVVAELHSDFRLSAAPAILEKIRAVLCNLSAPGARVLAALKHCGTVLSFLRSFPSGNDFQTAMTRAESVAVTNEHGRNILADLRALHNVAQLFIYNEGGVSMPALVEHVHTILENVGRSREKGRLEATIERVRTNWDHISHFFADGASNSAAAYEVLRNVESYVRSGEFLSMLKTRDRSAELLFRFVHGNGEHETILHHDALLEHVRYALLAGSGAETEMRAHMETFAAAYRQARKLHTLRVRLQVSGHPSHQVSPPQGATETERRRVHVDSAVPLEGGCDEDRLREHGTVLGRQHTQWERTLETVCAEEPRLLLLGALGRLRLFEVLKDWMEGDVDPQECARRLLPYASQAFPMLITDPAPLREAVRAYTRAHPPPNVLPLDTDAAAASQATVLIKYLSDSAGVYWDEGDDDVLEPIELVDVTPGREDDPVAALAAYEEYVGVAGQCIGGMAPLQTLWATSDTSFAEINDWLLIVMSPGLVGAAAAVNVERLSAVCMQYMQRALIKKGGCAGCPVSIIVGSQQGRAAFSHLPIVSHQKHTERRGRGCAYAADLERVEGGGKVLETVQVVVGPSRCGKSRWIREVAAVAAVGDNNWRLLYWTVHEAFNAHTCIVEYTKACQELQGNGHVVFHVEVCDMSADLPALNALLTTMINAALLLDHKTGNCVALDGHVAHHVYVELPELCPLDLKTAPVARDAWSGAQGEHPMIADLPVLGCFKGVQRINPTTFPLIIDAEATLVAQYLRYLDDESLIVPSTFPRHVHCSAQPAEARALIEAYLSDAPAITAERVVVIRALSVTLPYLADVCDEVRRQETVGRGYRGVHLWVVPAEERRGPAVGGGNFCPYFYRRLIRLLIAEACQLATGSSGTADVATVWSLRPKATNDMKLLLCWPTEGGGLHHSHPFHDMPQDMAHMVSECEPGETRALLASYFGYVNTGRFKELLSEAGFILTPHLIHRLIHLHLRRLAGGSFILEGGTGIGKSMLLRLYSLIVNGDPTLVFRPRHHLVALVRAMGQAWQSDLEDDAMRLQECQFGDSSKHTLELLRTVVCGDAGIRAPLVAAVISAYFLSLIEHYPVLARALEGNPHLQRLLHAGVAVSEEMKDRVVVALSVVDVPPDGEEVTTDAQLDAEFAFADAPALDPATLAEIYEVDDVSQLAALFPLSSAGMNEHREPLCVEAEPPRGSSTGRASPTQDEVLIRAVALPASDRLGESTSDAGEYGGADAMSVFQSFEDLEELLGGLLSLHSGALFRRIVANEGLGVKEWAEMMDSVIEAALATPEAVLVVFVDELNTAGALGFVSEAITSHRFNGLPLPENIMFVGAINPLESEAKASNLNVADYSTMRQLPVENEELERQALAPPEEDENGDYLAHIPFIVKMLSASAQTTIVRQHGLSGRTERAFLAELLDVSVDQPGHVRRAAVDMIQAAQAFVANAGLPRVHPSIRCLVRSVTLFAALMRIRVAKQLNLVDRSPVEGERISPFLPRTNNVNEGVGVALIVAVALTYFCRLPGDGHVGSGRCKDDLRSKFVEDMVPHLCNLEQRGYIPHHCSFVTVFNDALAELWGHVEVPVGIVPTTPLKESVFAVILCSLLKIAVLQTGPPGSGKTLSFILAKQNMRGSESTSDVFAQLPIMLDEPYQCSEFSSAQEIVAVSERALTRQVTEDMVKPGKYVCTMSLDEAGLPRERRQALKGLHDPLEEGKVSFVLMSNTTLDAAKTSRCLQILQSQSTQIDREAIAKGIIFGNDKEAEKQYGGRVIGLCEAFAALSREVPQERWYDSRDFLYLVKQIAKRTRDLGRERGNFDAAILLDTLRRNFQPQIASSFPQVVGKFLSKTGVKLEGASVSPNPLASLRAWHADKVEDDVQSDALVAHFRHAMLIDASSSQLSLEVLRCLGLGSFSDSQPLALISLSRFRDDDTPTQQAECLSEIRRAVESGATVCLMDTGPIHSSLYSLLNRHYVYSINRTTHEREAYVTMAIGAMVEHVRVHPDTRIIVHLRASALPTTPLPFLSRFERYVVNVSDALEERVDALVSDPPGWLQPLVPECHRPFLQGLASGVDDFVTAVGSDSFHGLLPRGTVPAIVLATIDASPALQLAPPAPFRWALQQAGEEEEEEEEVYGGGNEEDEDAERRERAPATRLQAAVRDLNYLLMQTMTVGAMARVQPLLPPCYVAEYVDRQEHFSASHFLRGLARGTLRDDGLAPPDLAPPARIILACPTDQHVRQIHVVESFGASLGFSAAHLLDETPRRAEAMPAEPAPEPRLGVLLLETCSSAADCRSRVITFFTHHCAVTTRGEAQRSMLVIAGDMKVCLDEQVNFARRFVDEALQEMATDVDSVVPHVVLLLHLSPDSLAFRPVCQSASLTWRSVFTEEFGTTAEVFAHGQTTEATYADRPAIIPWIRVMFGLASRVTNAAIEAQFRDHAEHALWAAVQHISPAKFRPVVDGLHNTRDFYTASTSPASAKAALLKWLQGRPALVDAVLSSFAAVWSERISSLRADLQSVNARMPVVAAVRSCERWLLADFMQKCVRVYLFGQWGLEALSTAFPEASEDDADAPPAALPYCTAVLHAAALVEARVVAGGAATTSTTVVCSLRIPPSTPLWVPVRMVLLDARAQLDPVAVDHSGGRAGAQWQAWQDVLHDERAFSKCLSRVVELLYSSPTLCDSFTHDYFLCHLNVHHIPERATSLVKAVVRHLVMCTLPHAITANRSIHPLALLILEEEIQSLLATLCPAMSEYVACASESNTDDLLLLLNEGDRDLVTVDVAVAALAAATFEKLWASLRTLQEAALAEDAHFEDLLSDWVNNMRGLVWQGSLFNAATPLLLEARRAGNEALNRATIMATVFHTLAVASTSQERALALTGAVLRGALAAPTPFSAAVAMLNGVREHWEDTRMEDLGQVAVGMMRWLLPALHDTTLSSLFDLKDVIGGLVAPDTSDCALLFAPLSEVARVSSLCAILCDNLNDDYVAGVMEEILGRAGASRSGVYVPRVVSAARAGLMCEGSPPPERVALEFGDPSPPHIIFLAVAKLLSCDDAISHQPPIADYIGELEAFDEFEVGRGPLWAAIVRSTLEMRCMSAAVGVLSARLQVLHSMEDDDPSSLSAHDIFGPEFRDILQHVIQHDVAAHAAYILAQLPPSTLPLILSNYAFLNDLHMEAVGPGAPPETVVPEDDLLAHARRIAQYQGRLQQRMGDVLCARAALHNNQIRDPQVADLLEVIAQGTSGAPGDVLKMMLSVGELDELAMNTHAPALVRMFLFAQRTLGGCYTHTAALVTPLDVAIQRLQPGERQEGMSRFRKFLEAWHELQPFLRDYRACNRELNIASPIEQLTDSAQHAANPDGPSPVMVAHVVHMPVAGDEEQGQPLIRMLRTRLMHKSFEAIDCHALHSVLTNASFNRSGVLGEEAQEILPALVDWGDANAASHQELVTGRYHKAVGISAEHLDEERDLADVLAGCARWVEDDRVLDEDENPDLSLVGGLDTLLDGLRKAALEDGRKQQAQCAAEGWTMCPFCKQPQAFSGGCNFRSCGTHAHGNLGGLRQAYGCGREYMGTENPLPNPLRGGELLDLFIPKDNDIALPEVEGVDVRVPAPVCSGHWEFEVDTVARWVVGTLLTGRVKIRPETPDKEFYADFLLREELAQTCPNLVEDETSSEEVLWESPVVRLRVAVGSLARGLTEAADAVALPLLLAEQLRDTMLRQSGEELMRALLNDLSTLAHLATDGMSEEGVSTTTPLGTIAGGTPPPGGWSLPFNRWMEVCADLCLKDLPGMCELAIGTYTDRAFAEVPLMNIPLPEDIPPLALKQCHSAAHSALPLLRQQVEAVAVALMDARDELACSRRDAPMGDSPTLRAFYARRENANPVSSLLLAPSSAVHACHFGATMRLLNRMLDIIVAHGGDDPAASYVERAPEGYRETLTSEVKAGGAPPTGAFPTASVHPPAPPPKATALPPKRTLSTVDKRQASLTEAMTRARSREEPPAPTLAAEDTKKKQKKRKKKRNLRTQKWQESEKIIHLEQRAAAVIAFDETGLTRAEIGALLERGVLAPGGNDTITRASLQKYLKATVSHTDIGLSRTAFFHLLGKGALVPGPPTGGDPRVTCESAKALPSRCHTLSSLAAAIGPSERAQERGIRRARAILAGGNALAVDDHPPSCPVFAMVTSVLQGEALSESESESGDDGSDGDAELAEELRGMIVEWRAEACFALKGVQCLLRKDYEEWLAEEGGLDFCPACVALGGSTGDDTHGGCENSGDGDACCSGNNGDASTGGGDSECNGGDTEGNGSTGNDPGAGAGASALLREDSAGHTPAPPDDDLTKSVAVELAAVRAAAAARYASEVLPEEAPVASTCFVDDPSTDGDSLGAPANPVGYLLEHNNRDAAEAALGLMKTMIKNACGVDNKYKEVKRSNPRYTRMIRTLAGGEDVLLAYGWCCNDEVLTWTHSPEEGKELENSFLQQCEQFLSNAS